MRGCTHCVTGCKKKDDGEKGAESTSVGKRLAETNTLQARSNPACSQVQHVLVLQ